MTIATFVLVLTVVLAAYRFVVVQPERRARRRIHERLTGPAPVQAPETADITQVTLADRLARAQRAPKPLRILYVACVRLTQMIEQSGWALPLHTFALLSGVAAVILAVLVSAAGGSILAAIAAALVGALSPVAALLQKRHARLRKFEDLLSEATDVIARALRAGHTLPAALQMVGDEVPDPVGSEFRRLHEHFRFGVPLPEVLRHFAERVPLVDARFLATAILLQRETGGNLSELLDNLAVVIRDRLRVRRQVRTVTAHGRLTGWILSALPPVIALALSIIRPEYISTLVSDSLGIQLLIVALTLEMLGIVFIRRIVRVEY